MTAITIHADPGQEDKADALAVRLVLPRGGDGDVLLAVTDGGLELRVRRAADATLVGGLAVRADLLRIDASSPEGRSRKAPLPRAAWPRRWADPPRVLDATAGLGGDAWLLASFGCRVTAVERHGVVHALLSDALRRAAAAGPVEAATAGLVTPVHGDAVDVIRGWSGARPRVVMIDPMFPAKRRATERKAMRVLRAVLETEPAATGAHELLAAARRLATGRVIVKRPRKAPPLPGDAPARAAAGKAIRFDVYDAAA